MINLIWATSWVLFNQIWTHVVYFLKNRTVILLSKIKLLLIRMRHYYICLPLNLAVFLQVEQSECRFKYFHLLICTARHTMWGNEKLISIKKAKGWMWWTWMWIESSFFASIVKHNKLEPRGFSLKIAMWVFAAAINLGH